MAAPSLLDMLATAKGSFRLFRFAGITVFLHWSWFLIAAYEVMHRSGNYSSPLWNAAEYLALFGIVLLHEFGHSLACRSVGGQSEQIILWPLGGIAYVRPPQRAGAQLWSIAAGPLVNVVLFFVFQMLSAFSRTRGWEFSSPDLAQLIRNIWWINAALLFFNLLPVYPLDGGQIFRSLLWFLVGPTRSLLVATSLGFIGVIGLVGLALVYTSQNVIWTLILAYFLGSNCWNGFKHARQQAKLEKAPRHTAHACPKCHTAPPAAPLWVCNQCRQPFDPFATGDTCPHCQGANAGAGCPACGAMSPITDWQL